MGSRRTHFALRRRAAIALVVWAVAFSLLAVASAIPEGPVAALTVDDAFPALGQAAHFNASASQGHDAGNGRIVAYRFDFGDGQGTGWQTSPLAAHAYTKAANVTASVTVVDARNATGKASVAVHVGSLPPPPVAAPEILPVHALLSPAEPRVNDSVNLTVDLFNRGTASASSAAVLAYDVRPDGSVAFLGNRSVTQPLAAAAGTSVSFPTFVAVQQGNHTLKIIVADVIPAEPGSGERELIVTMTVLGSRGSTSPDHGAGGPAFDVGPLAVGLAGAAVAAMAGAGYLLLRRPPKGPMEPPSAEPPDRSPPPLWPP